jgi:hypothetical protein
MIVGTSHMTLGTGDIEASFSHVANLGYAPDFYERNVPSPPCKHVYLKHNEDVHDLALSRSAGGLPIELISYPHAPSGDSGCFEGIFTGAPFLTMAPSQSECAEVAQAFGDCRGIILPGIELPATVISSTNRAVGLIGARIAVENITEALRFWCDGVGFREKPATGAAPTWRLVEFQSVMPAWRFKLLLVETDRALLAPTLDAPGFACLAFISSDIAGDSERLLKSGAVGSTGPFSVAVNRKGLEVEVLRGPAGEYVELLRIKKVDSE